MASETDRIFKRIIQEGVIQEGGKGPLTTIGEQMAKGIQKADIGKCIRQAKWSGSGSVKNLIKMLTCFISNNMVGVADGITAMGSLIDLPTDLASIASKPNEPLPSMVPISI